MGLPKGKASWPVFFTLVSLVAAGWLLQDRMNAPDRSDLDYSDLCRFIDEGKVSRLFLEGQSVVAELSAPGSAAGHGGAVVRSTMPSNDPNFFLLLRKEGARVGGGRGAGNDDSNRIVGTAARIVRMPGALVLASPQRHFG